VNAIDPVDLGIIWDRFVSIADEMVSTLTRTSFSTMVRVSADLSCMVFDSNARLLAQGRTSVPSFTGTGPPTLMQMLERIPPGTLRPGDVIATNDPWIGTGHVYDINVARPVFKDGRIVGYTLSVTHLPDIGGIGYSADGRDVYEEGFTIPVCKIIREGEPDAFIMELIRTNVRAEDQVLGDIFSNVSCTEVGARLFIELMEDYQLDQVDDLAHAIHEQTRDAISKRLARVTAGTYRDRMQVEGYDEPLTFAIAASLSSDGVVFDFDGTSPAVSRGINVPLCYTRAFCNYALKCLTAPEIPNNNGALDLITVNAPRGCVLNAVKPSPTGGRHILGHFVFPLIFGALQQAFPDDVQADSGMLSQLNFHGRLPDGRFISSVWFSSGGYGAFRDRDGRSALPGPSNMIVAPTELWEVENGISVLRKALMPDSGGAGRTRGGAGQEVVLRNDTGATLDLAVFASRSDFPARGFDGAPDATLRRVTLDGQPVHPKQRVRIAPGSLVRIEEAGGAGFGDPRARDPDAIAEDLRRGIVTENGAQRDYGV
jgi:N-methylhydantoinase B